MFLLTIGIVQLLVYVLIAVIAISVIYWLITRFVPEPLKGYAVAIVVVIGAILLIYLLLGLVNGGGLKL
jgi:hypothetical protein